VVQLALPAVRGPAVDVFGRAWDAPSSPWPLRDLRCLLSITEDSIRAGLPELVRAYRDHREPGPQAHQLLVVLAAIPTAGLPAYHLIWVHRSRTLLARGELMPLKKVRDEKAWELRELRA